jgi:hypothetical protein
LPTRWRTPASAVKSVDLPVLGFPTRATRIVFGGAESIEANSRFVVDLNLLRFGFAQAQPIAAKLELERIAKWGCAQAADFDAGCDSHFHEAAADLVRTDDSEDVA